MASELVALGVDQPEDPRYAACYASGSVFKPEEGGRFHRVEKGHRRLVSRALCVLQYFESRCAKCPNSVATLHFGVARGA
jgi:hypothetical protein